MFIPLPFYSPMDAIPGLEINTLLDYLFKFFLSSVRLSAFLISSPFLGSRNIPLNVKIVFSMVISFFYFGYISDTEITINEIENLFIIVVIEAIIGIALGLSLSIWFSAATLAGEKMASSTGLGFSTPNCLGVKNSKLYPYNPSNQRFGGLKPPKRSLKTPRSTVWGVTQVGCK